MPDAVTRCAPAACTTRDWVDDLYRPTTGARRGRFHRPRRVLGWSARLSQVRSSEARERELGDRNAWLALAVTTLVFFLSVIDISAVNVAFPSMRDDFGVSESTLGWVISGYNVTVAALLLVAGRYADSFGRKRLFIPGVATFMIGSMLSALAPSVGFLIAARVVQGGGSAIIAATAIAVVIPDFPPNKRSTVIGITGATGALGAVVGPALGAFLTDVWSWRGIFWINVPLSIVVLALAPRLLRESKNPNATGKIDLVGVPIGAAGVGLVMFAIVRSEEWGVLDLRSLSIGAVGLVLVWMLVRRSRDHSEPLLELDLFALRSFASTNAGLALYSMAFTSGFLINSLLLQELWDQPLSVVGAALVPAPLLATLVSPVAGRYADRIGHRWILASGSALCGLPYLAYILLLDDEPAVWTVFVPLGLVVGVGVGLSIATWASAGLSDVNPAQFGTANATIRTTQQIGYALGISMIVTILADVSLDPQISDFRWAWAFVGIAYLAAAAMIALTFPKGNSESRVE
ncbi:MAG: EmrB/QacA subfamily drug resistance transporter [Ilumatobacter sp.]